MKRYEIICAVKSKRFCSMAGASGRASIFPSTRMWIGGIVLKETQRPREPERPLEATSTAAVQISIQQRVLGRGEAGLLEPRRQNPRANRVSNLALLNRVAGHHRVPWGGACVPREGVASHAGDCCVGDPCCIRYFQQSALAIRRSMACFTWQNHMSSSTTRTVHLTCSCRLNRR